MVSRAPEERSHSQIIEAPEEDVETRSLINHAPVQQLRRARKCRVSVFNKVMAVVNLVLGLVLATSIGVVAQESNKSCAKDVSHAVEPYSPALEAVVPIIKKFRPEPIFRSETTDAVDAAWKKLEGVNGGVVALDPQETAKLTKTSHMPITSTSEPEKHFYGISMYQQLRCLNTIRKSFYQDKFYSGLTDKMFQARKNDCFDFLRQAIQCHGDVSMIYLTKENYNNERDGTESLSDWFGSDLEARTDGASVFWDVEHSCRALEPIENWVAEHQGRELY